MMSLWKLLLVYLVVVMVVADTVNGEKRVVVRTRDNGLSVTHEQMDKRFPGYFIAAAITPSLASLGNEMRFSESGELFLPKGHNYNPVTGEYMMPATSVVSSSASEEAAKAAATGDVLASIHRECPRVDCGIDSKCPYKDGICCGGMNVTACCPGTATCLTTDPPTCVHDHKWDAARCAEETCSFGTKCPHNGINLCCVGGLLCCPEGWMCKAVIGKEAVCKQMKSEEEMAELAQMEKEWAAKEQAAHEQTLNSKKESHRLKAEAIKNKHDEEQVKKRTSHNNVLQQETLQFEKALEEERAAHEKEKEKLQEAERDEKAAAKSKNKAVVDQLSAARQQALEEARRFQQESIDAKSRASNLAIKAAADSAKFAQLEANKAQEATRRASQAKEEGEKTNAANLRAAQAKAKEEGEKREAARKKEEETQKKLQQAQDRIRKHTIVAHQFSPSHNARVNFQFSWRGVYSFMFWIKPTGIVGPWGNIFHSSSHRRPAVWFFPGSTRLHIRSETRLGWSTGCDPSLHLSLHRWHHVAFTHSLQGLQVFIDNQSVCYAGIGAPFFNQASFMWFGHGDIARCVLADVRYYPEVISTQEIGEAFQARLFGR